MVILFFAYFSLHSRGAYIMALVDEIRWSDAEIHKSIGFRQTDLIDKVRELSVFLDSTLADYYSYLKRWALHLYCVNVVRA